jgi:hypothetical protein
MCCGTASRSSSGTHGRSGACGEVLGQLGANGGVDHNARAAITLSASPLMSATFHAEQPAASRART